MRFVGEVSSAILLALCCSDLRWRLQDPKVDGAVEEARNSRQWFPLPAEDFDACTRALSKGYHGGRDGLAAEDILWTGSKDRFYIV